jgi:hypothetical protein
MARNSNNAKTIFIQIFDIFCISKVLAVQSSIVEYHVSENEGSVKSAENVKKKLFVFRGKKWFVFYKHEVLFFHENE